MESVVEKPDSLETVKVLPNDQASVTAAAVLFIRSALMGIDHAVEKTQFADSEDLDVLPFEQAVRYMSKKSPMSKEAYYALSDKLKFRAFTVSRIADGDVLERVKGQLSKAIEDGSSLRDFLQKTDEDILDGVGLGRGGGWYWETVYRTNVQTSYNVGRAMGFESVPPVALELVGVSDMRQTEICHSLTQPPVRRPYGDPFWQTHWPPFHFNCRTTVRAIYDEAELQKDPVTAVPKEVRPPKDFGAYPVDNDNWWEELKDQRRRAKKYDVQKEIETAKTLLIDGSFKEAKTINEANRYAEQTLGVRRADYTGCDIKTANEWNRGLYDTFERFPEMKNKTRFTGECHRRNKAMKDSYMENRTEAILSDLKKLRPNTPEEELRRIARKEALSDFRQFSVSRNTYAQSFNPPEFLKEFSGVTVNGDWGKNSKEFIEYLAHDVKNKFHPVGTETIRSVLDHEIGHQIDDWLDISKDPVIMQLYSTSKEDITNGLSRYSWQNSSKNKIREFVAEGWAEYCNNPVPRPMAKTIGETIMRRYASWKKNS